MKSSKFSSIGSHFKVPVILVIVEIFIGVYISKLVVGKSCDIVMLSIHAIATATW